MGTATYTINVPQAATPTFSPAAGTYTTTQSVTISDATSGAAIFYTTDGNTPTTGSTRYTGAIPVAQTTTIKAMATASGLGNSGVGTATYTINVPQAATPTFSPAAGTYTTTQSVTISDATSGAAIFYTTDGNTPTTGSTRYTGAISVAQTTTIKAMATASGLGNSGVAVATYTIGSAAINYSSGFVANGLGLNGTAKLNGSRLQLTDGGLFEAASAFFNTAVNVQSFTNDFTFQLSNAGADGMTFTIQGNGPTALGPRGGGLGYGPDAPGAAPGIGNSVAVKFDIYDNAGEGPNSTGLYSNGVSPTTPATALTGIDLHSGHVFSAHMTYNGTTLAMTITDVSNPALTFSTSYAVNIPAIIGASAGYIGFTGGTGVCLVTQEIITWTYQNGVAP